jgi:hypothetical protein
MSTANRTLPIPPTTEPDRARPVHGPGLSRRLRGVLALALGLFGLASGWSPGGWADTPVSPAAAAPVTLTQVGQWMGGDYRDTVIAGHYAYAAAGADGLLILDISDPAKPAPVGRYDTPAFFANGVALVGGLAFCRSST